MNTLQIRPARPEDYPRWRPLWDGYQKFYDRHGPTALPEEVTQTTWQRFFDDKEPLYALVAERDSTILGIAHYLYHRNTGTLAHSCYLQDLYTVESARGQGVGEALIDAVCERAKAAGSARIYWQTHESNAIARSLYDRVAERSEFIIYRKPV